ncbi:MYXO-CTERM sorting domain-containing protein [Myxococcota bacterium]|nr:MYXO-CTERM sorting domain-containing protein [Myxococcota bacterium]
MPVLSLLLAPSLALAVPTPARTWIVDPGGAGDFPTIGEAIAAAESGDRIEVAAGSYAECLDLGGRDLELVGVEGAEATLLSGAEGCEVTLTAALGEALTLQGLSITGASRAISVVGGALALQEVIVHDAGDGAGEGGGLRVEGGSLWAQGCAFRDNLGAQGGALHLSAGATAQVEDCAFSGNLAIGSGGAIHATGGSLDLWGSSLSDNLADGAGGALYASAVERLAVQASSLCGNQAAQGGGAHTEGGTEASWANVRLQENVASLGAALSVTGGGDTTLVQLSVLGNQAGRAAVELSDSRVAWTNNLVAWTVGGAALYGEGDAALESSFGSSAWYDNEGGDGSGSHLDVTSGIGMVTADPLLVDLDADGDCADDDLRLGEGSPLRDAGDEALVDPDGSRSDIGWFGGEGAWAFDADGDGAWTGGDCDDAEPAALPGGTERCDGIDNDCDGRVDLDAVDMPTWYPDGDGDGWGLEGEGLVSCDGPEGASTLLGDCDDFDGEVHPGAGEIPYDGVDNDCDGADARDVDGDGVEGALVGGADCDDEDPAVYGGAVEVWYDGVDADCAGDSDYDADHDGQDGEDWGGTDCDDADPTVYFGAIETWYDDVDGDCLRDDDHDADGDGQTAESSGGADCDDTDAAVHAGAVESWYDGRDGDCDHADDYDADGDGHRASTWAGDDCDDTDPTVSPDATEHWYDGIDADCDEESDYDMDGDGEDSDLFGGTDCDDADPDIGADALEIVGDGVDQDCDGLDGPAGTGDGGASDGGTSGDGGGATGEEPGEEGKGCATAPGRARGSWPTLGLLGLLLLRRRRR